MAPWRGLRDSKDVLPMAGLSLLATLRGQKRPTRQFLCWHYGGFGDMTTAHKIVLHGQYKALQKGQAAWVLYDLEKDPTELEDHSAKQPELLAGMKQEWSNWMARCEKESGQDYHTPKVESKRKPKDAE